MPKIEVKEKINAAKECIGILGQDGKFFHSPNPCKNYTHEMVGRIHFEKYARPQIAGLVRAGVKPYEDILPLVLYCSPKTRLRNASKFLDIINEIEEKMGVEGLSIVEVPEWENKDSAPFIAVAPPFWGRSPVLVSFYCLMMRLSTRMHMEETWEEFKARMAKNKDTHRDVIQFNQAIQNGNIDGVINKTLPLFKRRGYIDHLLNQHDRGICDYNSQADEKLPYTQKEILKLRGINK